MSVQKHISISIILALLLNACGGGGSAGSGGETNTSNPNPSNLVAGNSPALASSDNSYRNFKQINLTPQEVPTHGDARGYGNFLGLGKQDLFLASLRYSLSKETPQTAAPSHFSFWEKTDTGSYVEKTDVIISGTGCIHPRKALVADFNVDGKPDVFVVCHGWDAAPFPGEKNKIVLSQANGKYVINDAANDVGFFHGASAADLNADGYPDIVAVNSFDPQTVMVFLNKKDGSFYRESGTRLPTSLKGGAYFSIELLDINEDGKLDLMVGGHEWENAPTKAFINPGNNIFEGVTPISIPAIANEGVVLDFTVTGAGADRSLWVLRTSGGDGTFYQSRVIQKVNLTSLTSSIALKERPGNSLPWIIPAVVNGQKVITSDKQIDGLSIPQ